MLPPLVHWASNMGRYLKNTQLEGGSYAVQLPLGSATVGPDVPVNGQIRFNQTNNKIEFYYNSQWNSVAKIGQVPIVVDSFTTYDGGVNQFTMSYQYRDGQEASVLVFVGGVQQKPGNGSSTPNNYYFSTGTPSDQIYLTPSTSGDAGQPVLVIHNLNSTDAA